MIQQTQQASQEEIDRVLARLQQAGVGMSTKPVLFVNIQAQMRAKNNGYPLDMYHSELDPRQAMNEKQEEMLVSQGYGPAYKPHAYPKYLHRRNFHPKFDSEQPGLTDEQKNAMNPFLESRLVINRDAEMLLRRQMVPKSCSPWFDRADELPPITEEDLPEIDTVQVAAIAAQQPDNAIITELLRQIGELRAQVLQGQPKPEPLVVEHPQAIAETAQPLPSEKARASTRFAPVKKEFVHDVTPASEKQEQPA